MVKNLTTDRKGKGREFPLDTARYTENGREQSLRVGMLGLPIKRFCRSHFDEFAGVHDGDAVGDVFDKFKVVGDEEIGEAEFFAGI